MVDATAIACLAVNDGDREGFLQMLPSRPDWQRLRDRIRQVIGEEGSGCSTSG